MTDLATLRALIKAGEGSVSHMYLDTRGNVTVGVGQLLRTADEAKQLPFVHRDTQTAASAQDIELDFDAVAKQTAGRSAGAYRQYTRLDLPEAAIDTLLDWRIAEFQTGLQAEFSGYDAYPDPAKEALLDMAFNLGLSGLVRKFPKLKRAAESGEWAICARECERHGIGEARNQETKALFERTA